MRCQKCGARMAPEHLYCEHCGAELQIVPDYESEIENSMAEILTAVGETVEENKPLFQNLEKEPEYREETHYLEWIPAIMAGTVCLLFFALLWIRYNATFFATMEVTEDSLSEVEMGSAWEGPEAASTELPEKTEPPQIFPESGTYSMAGRIEVVVPEGSRVYYMADITTPTEERGMLYTEPIPMPLGESNYSFISVDEKGNVSECVRSSYMLNLKTGVSVEEAETKLMQELIVHGRILNTNGSIEGRYGVYRYFYQYPISVEQKNYYVFEEHYMENLLDEPQGNFYAVDVMDGSTYELLQDTKGEFVCVKM